ncbi:kinesin-domain-containing protein [Hesseltinella vesiculosa]|uniref:Kinesin-like protein n=1 Tax=Hesseltinella vesiculosa TaxID=101127 RepID=A0A1X2GF02_9FUNG|nr:kinesin-domain-containing protein [Hesseltinella vesiculosa]
MSSSGFLDTLRKHDLDQFYSTFSMNGINHLQHLAQLSMQDYAQLGITDIADRRKIFSLIQLVRRDAHPRSTIPSASTVTSSPASGLRKPASYGSPRSSTDQSAINGQPSLPTYGSRLPQPATSTMDTTTSRIARARRPSLAPSLQRPTPSISTMPLPTSPTALYSTTTTSPPMPLSAAVSGVSKQQSQRFMRQRTMSDAGSRLDPTQLPVRHSGSGLPSPRAQKQQQQQRARRSLHLEQDLRAHEGSQTSDEEDDESSRRYRTSAPLLNAYGAPKVRTRASMSALKYSSTSSSQTQNGSLTSPSLASPAPALPPSDLNQKIRVCVRKRPLNRKERDRGDKDITPCLGTRSLHVNEPKLRLDMSKYIEQHNFTFDDVFDMDEANEVVYERTALPLVHYIFQGGKATCFAYGQTGSGKTYTMLDPHNGLYMMAAEDIFAMIRRPENQHLCAWIGLYEIYQGQLYDLLNARKKLFAREDGKRNVIIAGLKEYPIDNVDKLVQVFEYGNLVRSTGSTGANDSSSRSHAVLQILLKPKKNKKKIHGKLSFIDLAGSERGADRGETDSKTRMEGAEINKSLLALKECIRALDQDKRHTPFRQSKLTQVLKDSFVGKSRTCMIATISPSSSNSEHTLNTLRYADRVKELKKETNMQRSGSQGSVDPMAARRYSSHSYGDEDGLMDDDDDALMLDSPAEDDDDDEPDDFVDDDSDILDEETYKIEEENIFDVDFPHAPDDEVFHVMPSSQHAKLPLKDPPPQCHLPAPSFAPAARAMAAPPPLPPTMSRGSTMPDPTGSAPTSPGLSHHRQPASMTRSHSSHPSSPVASTKTMSMHDLMPSPDPFAHPSPSPSATMDYDDMDEFVQFHRAQIRCVSDDTKRESKLVATMSLHLNASESDKCQLHFQSYLQTLDLLLEEKMAAISALRDRVNDTLTLLDDDL